MTLEQDLVAANQLTEAEIRRLNMTEAELRENFKDVFKATNETMMGLNKRLSIYGSWSQVVSDVQEAIHGLNREVIDVKESKAAILKVLRESLEQNFKDYVVSDIIKQLTPTMEEVGVPDKVNLGPDNTDVFEPAKVNDVEDDDDGIVKEDSFFEDVDSAAILENSLSEGSWIGPVNLIEVKRLLDKHVEESSDPHGSLGEGAELTVPEVNAMIKRGLLPELKKQKFGVKAAELVSKKLRLEDWLQFGLESYARQVGEGNVNKSSIEKAEDAFGQAFTAHVVAVKIKDANSALKKALGFGLRARDGRPLSRDMWSSRSLWLRNEPFLAVVKIDGSSPSDQNKVEAVLKKTDLWKFLKKNNLQPSVNKNSLDTLSFEFLRPEGDAYSKIVDAFHAEMADLSAKWYRGLSESVDSPPPVKIGPSDTTSFAPKSSKDVEDDDVEESDVVTEAAAKAYLSDDKKRLFLPRKSFGAVYDAAKRLAKINLELDVRPMTRNALASFERNLRNHGNVDIVDAAKVYKGLEGVKGEGAKDAELVHTALYGVFEVTLKEDEAVAEAYGARKSFKGLRTSFSKDTMDAFKNSSFAPFNSTTGLSRSILLSVLAHWIETGSEFVSPAIIGELASKEAGPILATFLKNVKKAVGPNFKVSYGSSDEEGWSKTGPDSFVVGMRIAVKPEAVGKGLSARAAYRIAEQIAKRSGVEVSKPEDHETLVYFNANAAPGIRGYGKFAEAFKKWWRAKRASDLGVSEADINEALTFENALQQYESSMFFSLLEKNGMPKNVLERIRDELFLTYADRSRIMRIDEAVVGKLLDAQFGKAFAGARARHMNGLVKTEQINVESDKRGKVYTSFVFHGDKKFLKETGDWSNIVGFVSEMKKAGLNYLASPQKRNGQWFTVVELSPVYDCSGGINKDLARNLEDLAFVHAQESESVSEEYQKAVEVCGAYHAMTQEERESLTVQDMRGYLEAHNILYSDALEADDEDDDEEEACEEAASVAESLAFADPKGWIERSAYLQAFFKGMNPIVADCWRRVIEDAFYAKSRSPKNLKASIKSALYSRLAEIETLIASTKYVKRRDGHCSMKSVVFEEARVAFECHFNEGVQGWSVLSKITKAMNRKGYSVSHSGSEKAASPEGFSVSLLPRFSEVVKDLARANVVINKALEAGLAESIDVTEAAVPKSKIALLKKAMATVNDSMGPQRPDHFFKLVDEYKKGDKHVLVYQQHQPDYPGKMGVSRSQLGFGSIFYFVAIGPDFVGDMAVHLLKKGYLPRPEGDLWAVASNMMDGYTFAIERAGFLLHDASESSVVDAARRKKLRLKARDDYNARIARAESVDVPDKVNLGPDNTDVFEPAKVNDVEDDDDGIVKEDSEEFGERTMSVKAKKPTAKGRKAARHLSRGGNKAAQRRGRRKALRIKKRGGTRALAKKKMQDDKKAGKGAGKSLKDYKRKLAKQAALAKSRRNNFKRVKVYSEDRTTRSMVVEYLDAVEPFLDLPAGELSEAEIKECQFLVSESLTLLYAETKSEIIEAAEAEPGTLSQMYEVAEEALDGFNKAD